MPEYRLFETKGFQQDLERLGPVASHRIRETLERRVYPVLRATPRNAPSAAKLQAWQYPTWRIRIGRWRVFYEIDDAKRTVFLTAADHRKDAYR